MAYRIVTLVAAPDPDACVDAARVTQATQPFRVRDVRAFESGTSLDFRLDFDNGGECYVEVDTAPELIGWYAAKYEKHAGRPFDPTPNVLTSWTLLGEMDLDAMHDVADAVTPGHLVTAWDDVTGFDVRWR